MAKVIATATVNENQVQFVAERGNYYIYWGGEGDKYKSRQELRTLTGRKPTQSSAHKQFLKACEAAQYLKFEKL
jgi:hypothetical protein